jgi:hypothetical protein
MIAGLRLIIVFIGHFTARDYTLQITITQRLMFSVTVFTALLGNIFQQWTFFYSRSHILAGCRSDTSFLTSEDCLVSQSQNYFMTGSLLPIGSSWCQAPWGSWPEGLFFSQLNPCGCSHCVTYSMTRGWLVLGPHRKHRSSVACAIVVMLMNCLQCCNQVTALSSNIPSQYWRRQ